MERAYASSRAPCHSRPCPRRTALGPVDDIEVDIIEAEPLEAPLSLDVGLFSTGVELCGDENFFTGHAAFRERPPDTFLVAVRLGRVDVVVPEIERRADGVDALGAIGHLPDAQPEQRYLVAVRKHSCVWTACVWTSCHDLSS